MLSMSMEDRFHKQISSTQTITIGEAKLNCFLLVKYYRNQRIVIGQQELMVVDLTWVAKEHYQQHLWIEGMCNTLKL